MCFELIKYHSLTFSIRCNSPHKAILYIRMWWDGNISSIMQRVLRADMRRHIFRIYIYFIRHQIISKMTIEPKRILLLCLRSNWPRINYGPRKTTWKYGKRKEKEMQSELKCHLFSIRVLLAYILYRLWMWIGVRIFISRFDHIE